MANKQKKRIFFVILKWQGANAKVGYSGGADCKLKVNKWLPQISSHYWHLKSIVEVFYLPLVQFCQSDVPQWISFDIFWWNSMFQWDKICLKLMDEEYLCLSVLSLLLGGNYLSCCSWIYHSFAIHLQINLSVPVCLSFCQSIDASIPH